MYWTLMSQFYYSIDSLPDPQPFFIFIFLSWSLDVLVLILVPGWHPLISNSLYQFFFMEWLSISIKWGRKHWYRGISIWNVEKSAILFIILKKILEMDWQKFLSFLFSPAFISFYLYHSPYCDFAAFKKILIISFKNCRVWSGKDRVSSLCYADCIWKSGTEASRRWETQSRARSSSCSGKLDSIHILQFK